MPNIERREGCKVSFPSFLASSLPQGKSCPHLLRRGGGVDACSSRAVSTAREGGLPKARRRGCYIRTSLSSRPCRTKKRAPTMALIFRAPAKIAQRVLRDNFRAPAKIAQRVLREEGDAGVKENSLSFLKLFRNAPCGDVVGTTGLEPVTSRM